MKMIKEIWNNLENQVKKVKSGTVKILVDPDLDIYISLGLYAEDKRLFIAYEISENSITNYKSLPNIKGLIYKKIKYGDEREGYNSLVLSCASEIYNSSFNLLCTDLIEQSYNLKEINAVAFLAERLSIWKNFFSKVPIDVLGEEQQMGLAGELVFINLLLENNIDKQYVIKSWKGYEGASKDFVFSESIFTEVKASKSYKNVKISSKEQLDENQYEKGLLFYSKMSFSNESEQNLNTLIEKTREYLADNQKALNSFDTGLIQYGYNDAYKEFYSRGINLVKSTIYQLKEGFPRIKNTDLKDGVVTVKYTIDLTVAEKYEYSENKMIEDIKGQYDV